MPTGPSQRQLKVGEEVRHVLSEALMRGDFYDPDTRATIGNITVSEVRISPDLRNATVYVMPLGGENQTESVKRLERLSPQLRSMIAGKIRLRNLPVLTFRLDKTFDNATEIDQLLRRPEVKRDLT